MRCILGDFAERTTLFAEVHDEADAAALSDTDALLDGVDQVWLARADVGAEDVRSVTYNINCVTAVARPANCAILTFVMHPKSQFFRLIRQISRIANYHREVLRGCRKPSMHE